MRNVDADQLASYEASLSGSTYFHPHNEYVSTLKAPRKKCI